MEYITDLKDTRETNKTRYLIYFEPSTEIENLILEQEEIMPPPSGLHITLCSWDMDSCNEEELIKQISSVAISPFDIETTEYDNFAEEKIVLRFSKPKELLNLHNRMLDIVKQFTDEEYNNFFLQFFGEKYNPHLTISRTYLDFSFPKELIGKRYSVLNFFLARK